MKALTARSNVESCWNDLFTPLTNNYPPQHFIRPKKRGPRMNYFIFPRVSFSFFCIFSQFSPFEHFLFFLFLGYFFCIPLSHVAAPGRAAVCWATPRECPPPAQRDVETGGPGTTQAIACSCRSCSGIQCMAPTSHPHVAASAKAGKRPPKRQAGVWQRRVQGTAKGAPASAPPPSSFLLAAHPHFVFPLM